MFSFFKQKKGLAIVEVVVATAVVLLIVLSSYGANILYLRISIRNPDETKAAFLLEEGMEAVRLMRDDDWDTRIDSLSTGTTYYFYYNGTIWQATTTKIYIDNQFERSFTLSAVSRNSGGDIVTSGGTNDDGTRKVTVNVAWWSYNATTTKTAQTYITDIL